MILLQNFLDKQWALALDDLDQTISAIGLDLWIKKLKPINIEDENLVFVCPTEMAMNTVIRSYTPQILEALEKNFNLSKFKIILESEKDDYVIRHHLVEKSAENKEDLPKAVTNEEDPTNPLNPKYTFDNFVVGTTNQLIYAATRSVAENPGKRFNPLFIYGGVGLGKTHLLHAIGNYIWDTKHGKVKIVYTTSDNFTNEFVDVVRKGKDKGDFLGFRKKFRQADVLLIDDIQFFADRKKVQEEFFNTFNDLFAANKQIIIASDRPPKEIFGIEERLSSRFSQGLVQDIQKPDLETREMIIRKKIDIEGYQFKDEIIPLLADRFENYNIREIEGALNKLYLTAKLHGNFEVDEKVLSMVPDMDVGVGRVATQEKIIDAICIKFNIKRDDLFGRRRTKDVAEARQYCIYLMWRKLDLPLTSISKLFNRDHTTAIHARDKVLELVKTDSTIKKLVEELEDLVVH